MGIQQIAVEEFQQTLPIKEPRCYDPTAGYRYQQNMFCVLLVFVLFMLNMHAFILRLRYSTFGFFLMLFSSLSASLKTLQTLLCGESSVRLEMTKLLPAVLESLKNE